MFNKEQCYNKIVVSFNVRNVTGELNYREKKTISAICKWSLHAGHFNEQVKFSFFENIGLFFYKHIISDNLTVV